jgi:predicted short-subunit dehydrogenase-like oxidoreductase (DUF2520 family)
MTRTLKDPADFAMDTILRYAARVKGRARKRNLTVTLVGAGNLAGFLAPALKKTGYKIKEIAVRPCSRPKARRLAKLVGARVVTLANASRDVDILWFCVPDRAIRVLANAVADERPSRIRFAFHSSGVLASRELNALHEIGVAVASVHPLMTFVPESRPSLAGVPFALEGDNAALKLAKRVVRDLGAESFLLPPKKKVAYHAWATMTSPLLLAYLVTLEEVARKAGIGRDQAARMSLPIMQQTIANYSRRGPAESFSGPLIRGDATTMERHLELLKNQKARAVYVALAKIALERLPVGNRKEIRQLLERQ